MKTIFVSSTFSDMQYERDAIQDTVAPAINRVAKEYADTVSFCDLRWGINTSDLESDAASNKVLTVCLDEIDRSGSPMIVILGNRYGWIPPEDQIRNVVEQKKIVLDNLRKSITALEVEFGAFYAKKHRDLLFYFRQVENAPESYFDSDPEYTALLSQLKTKIAEIPNARIRYYTLSFRNKTVHGLSEFTQMLIEDLQGVLMPLWEENRKLSPFDLEQKKHWEFITSKANYLYARKQLADEWISSLDSDPSLIIKGDSGIGKTTIFSYIAVKLREQGFNPIAYTCGLTPETYSAGNILKKIIFSLEQLLQIPHVSTEELLKDKPKEQAPPHKNVLFLQTGADEKAVPAATRLVYYLSDLCSQCTNRKIKVAIMVDALDQLLPDEYSDHLASNPFLTSEYVKCILSCVSDFSTFGSKFRVLPPLERSDIPEAVRGILSENNKELPEELIEHLLSKKASDNCLYLSLLIQRLVLFNRKDYNAINRLGNGEEAIISYLKKIIKKSPSSPEKISVVVLNEAAKRINPVMIQTAVSYLACSKFGLAYDDFKKLLANDFIAVDFSAFINYLNEFFAMDEAGKISFSHRLIKNGLLKNCRNRAKIHQKLFHFFFNLENENKCRTYESAYHAILSNRQDLLYSLITELKKTDQTERIKAAAIDCHQQCMETGTKWIKNTVNRYSNDPLMVYFLGFLLDDLCPMFADLETEQIKHRELLRICVDRMPTVLSSVRTDEGKALYVKALNEYGDVYLFSSKKKSLRTAIEHYDLAAHTSAEIIDEEIRAYSAATSYRNLGYALNKELESKDNLPFWEREKQLKKIETDCYLKAVGILTDCIEKFSSKKSEYLIANCFDNLGDLTLSFDLDRDEILSRAETYYLKALEVRKAICKSGVDVRGMRTLSRSYSRLIELYLDTPYCEKWKNALDLSVKNVELNRHITELEVSKSTKRKLAESYTKQAICLLNLRFTPGYSTAYQDACHLYERAAQIYRTLYEEVPSETDERSYIGCLSEMAWIIIDQPFKDRALWDKAADYITQAHSLSEQTSGMDNIDQVRYYNALGDLEKLMNGNGKNTETAIRYYREAKKYITDELKALAEVYAILPFLEEGMIEQLPWEIYITIKKHSYRLFRKENDLNESAPLQSLSRRAIAVLSYFNLSYWMNSREERDELEQIHRDNELKQYKKKKK